MTPTTRLARELDRWVEIADHCRHVTEHGVDPPPLEHACTGFDPWPDLGRRADRWRHRLGDAGLRELSRFGAGLVQAESDAWSNGDGVTATQAYEDRRFLLGDRIIHWAVPWADVAGRCHHAIRHHAHTIRDHLLSIGDDMRIAPILTGPEGLHAPGEDSIGPLPPEAIDSIGLLGSGTILFAATMASMTAGVITDPVPSLTSLGPQTRIDLGVHYRTVGARWRRLSEQHAGSAMLWRDLSERADATSIALIEGQHDKPSLRAGRGP